METTAPEPIARTAAPTPSRWRWVEFGSVVALGTILIVEAFILKPLLPRTELTDQVNYVPNCQIRLVEVNLIRYRTGCGTLPSQAQGLAALVTKPVGDPVPRMWVQCMEASELLDPWGEPYQYRYPGKHKPNGYDLFSKGPDNKEDTADDIGNWD